MSTTEPMPLERRLSLYLGHPATALDRDSDLTPAQRRRAWHKALRSGERSGQGGELLGRKNRPTPRRIVARAAMLARRG